MSLLRLLLGRPLASSEQSDQKIGVAAGVPALGLDAISSSAYGPEAALTVLLPLGAAGLHYIGPLTLVILSLLAILYVSYRQTIAAYPNGGGSYVVAKDNLGTGAGLLAAAALMLDYVLTAAVGISAGIAALVSAFPALHRWTLPLCLLTLALITLVNLRGTSEAGWAFALPTYLFLASLGSVLALGVARAAAGGGHPQPVVPPPARPAATEAVGLWLLLRAFASGCTAMTGVEAVSNGITAFREPAVANARRTLTVIVAVLAVLLGGIAYLVRAYRVGAMDQTDPAYQSVLSQLTAAVVGRGWAYYVTIGSVLAVLALSANTSFVDFPRLCRLLARDDFLPRAFAVVGRRLVYSVGILFLAAATGLLLAAFGGITDRLIPLYAVGAFLAFTLSQAGMVWHWRKRLREGGGGRAHSRLAMAVNGTGALATAGALGVIVAAKFVEGAWVTLLAIPCLLLLFTTVKHHYEWVARQTSTRRPLDLHHNEPPVVLLPTRRWDRLTRKALRFGTRLSPDVIAVHISQVDEDVADDHEAAQRQQWEQEVERPARKAGVPPPRLAVINSPYREFIGPLLEFIGEVEKEFPGRPVAVIIPQLVKNHWWELLLHNHRAARLKRALLKRGSRRLVVISVPWHLDDEDEPGGRHASCG
jgi:amino acid transporter